MRFGGKSKTGAGDESRTRDLRLGKPALYQLSYTRVTGIVTPPRTGATSCPEVLARCRSEWPELVLHLRVRAATQRNRCAEACSRVRCILWHDPRLYQPLQLPQPAPEDDRVTRCCSRPIEDTEGAVADEPSSHRFICRRDRGDSPEIARIHRIVRAAAGLEAQAAKLPT